MNTQTSCKQSLNDHFQGKSPLDHIISVQADGVEICSEIHGAETPGTVFSFLDSARESILLVTLLSISLDFFAHASGSRIAIMWGIGSAWAFWKGARATWIAWMRLERLHRIIQEEKEEIEQNRDQEKEELKVLYAAKGLSGTLLHEVIDVFMADEERALKVMLEDELGLRLYQNSHPLVIGFSAFLGGVFALFIGLVQTALLTIPVMILLSAFFSCILGFIYARYENNRAIDAGCWSAGISIVTCIILSTVLKGILG